MTVPRLLYFFVFSRSLSCIFLYLFFYVLNFFSYICTHTHTHTTHNTRLTHTTHNTHTHTHTHTHIHTYTHTHTHTQGCRGLAQNSASIREALLSVRFSFSIFFCHTGCKGRLQIFGSVRAAEWREFNFFVIFFCLLFVLATQAAEDFRKISEAYERLSDESLRRAYDSAWMQMRAGVGAKELSVEDFFFFNSIYRSRWALSKLFRLCKGSIKALWRIS